MDAALPGEKTRRLASAMPATPSESLPVLRLSDRNLMRLLHCAFPSCVCDCLTTFKFLSIRIPVWLLESCTTALS